MAMIAAHAAWHMGAWEDMRKYVMEVEGSDSAMKVRASRLLSLRGLAACTTRGHCVSISKERARPARFGAAVALSEAGLC